MTLPKRRKKSPTKEGPKKRFPAHCNFVRSHECCVGNGECDGPIEVAHVRSGTDGGIGIKPSDFWTISLCSAHHRRQHQIGEAAFERQYGIDMKRLAEEFATASPKAREMREARQKLMEQRL